MSIFDIFRRKRKELDEDELRWDKMWELWENEEAASPYAEIMTYEAEINNGGHSQYFLNISNCGNLEKELEALYSVLPAKLKSNLKKAYEVYLTMTEENEDDVEEILDDCDDVFYDNEEAIEKILKKYAATLKP